MQIFKYLQHLEEVIRWSKRNSFPLLLTYLPLKQPYTRYTRAVK